jgi:hypothetical protein
MCPNEVTRRSRSLLLRVRDPVERYLAAGEQAGSLATVPPVPHELLADFVLDLIAVYPGGARMIQADIDCMSQQVERSPADADSSARYAAVYHPDVLRQAVDGCTQQLLKSESTVIAEFSIDMDTDRAVLLESVNGVRTVAGLDALPAPDHWN